MTRRSKPELSANEASELIAEVSAHDRLQARGIVIVPWTVNEPDDIRRILALGVDGIISDYPDRVLAIRDEGR